MKKAYLILALLITSFLVVVNAYGESEVYYCAETGKNGFYYEEKENLYKPTKITPIKFKLSLKINSKQIALARENGQRQSFNCTAPFSKAELLSCVMDFYHINFNTENGRFVLFTGYGYIAGDHDSIGVSFGKCDKF